jgi:hypothetical protein
MTREFADELLELIKAEPEHLIVLPARIKRPWWRVLLFEPWPKEVWLICLASIDEAGEYDLRPVAEVIGPNQRLRFNQYLNPLLERKESE